MTGKAPVDERIECRRVVLVPVTADDADAAAVVAWLDARGVDQVTAWIHPDHRASEAVAIRAGLTVTAQARTTPKHEHRERRWRRQRSTHR